MLEQRWLMRWLLIGFFLGTGLVWAIVYSLPDEYLHIIACDVGQGDAFLITYQQTQILIDGGPDDSVLECLSRHMPFWDRSIDLVVLSHPQADHMTGLISVLSRYTIEEFVGTGLKNETAEYYAFQEVLQSASSDMLVPRHGDVIRIGSLTFTVLWPRERMSSSGDGADLQATEGIQDDLNETSVVLQLQYGEFDAIFTGDIGFNAENQLLSSDYLEDIDVLKVAHHGSKNSSSDEFLQAVKPEISIISVGRNNSHGHPTKEVLGRLEAVGARILRTDLRGDVEVVSDGDKMWSH